MGNDANHRQEDDAHGRSRIQGPGGVMLTPVTGAVALQIPADAAFVRVARLTATGFGAMHGLTVDDLDDLRLVVDELCGYFIDLGTASPIALELGPRSDGPGIQIVARSSAPPEFRGPVDELRRQVLEALSEDLTIELGDDETELRASVVPSGQ